MIDNNILMYCDNLIGLQWLLDNGYQGKIDLVYIDPPYATGGNFTVDKSGRVSTISSAKDGIVAYSDKLQGKEFIQFIQERAILIRELLSNEGSFYIHTDYKIGHYVRVMLDKVFGFENFRNDITRIKCNPKNFERIGYGNIKDMILFYTKTNKPIWHEPKVSYSDTEIAKIYNKIDKNGRRYATVPIHAPGESKSGTTSKPFKGIYPPKGRHWRCSVEELERLDKIGLIEWSSTNNPRKINYADEMIGKRAQDIWEFKDPMYPTYPTQKNQDMLNFIIRTSSNQNSIVMDCFCGSGSTLKAAQDNGRRWIGMDSSTVAIDTTRKNLGNTQSLFIPEFSIINLSTA